VNAELENIRKGKMVAYFKIISQHFPERAEKSQEKP
jgi:hypothetical protein